MRIFWLGSVPYLVALRVQKALAAARANGVAPDLLLLLEHPPTITLGRGARREHVLASPVDLERRGVALHEIDRGGDVTYHGPGQLVGYPIVDLRVHGRDLHAYLRRIEGALIRTLTHWDLAARRFPPHTGVWIGERKIAAIGVHVRRWVTTHGFALNVDPDLAHFALIVPCGIREYGVTSLATYVSPAPPMEVVASLVGREFRREFGAPAKERSQDGPLIPDEGRMEGARELNELLDRTTQEEDAR